MCEMRHMTHMAKPNIHKYRHTHNFALFLTLTLAHIWRHFGFDALHMRSLCVLSTFCDQKKNTMK